MNHYLALDALRGLAALSVLLFHLGHWFDTPWLAVNGYLAVDFFFCLSGFVLALAFGKSKYRDLSLVRFMTMRLIRLMPLMIVADLVGAAYLLTKASVMHVPVAAGDVLSALVLGVLSIPDLAAPVSIGGPQVFPLNGPQYTLFLELVVNLLWFASRRVPQLPLSLAISGSSFLVLGWVGLGGDTASTLLLGLPRVCASFFAGVALFELFKRRPAWRLPRWLFAVLASAMLALFLLPLPLSLPFILVWSAAAVPLTVLAGAEVKMPSWLLAPSAMSGALSYPLYALHYPLFCWINGMLQARLHHQNAALETPVVIAGVLLGSALTLKFVDEPLRRKLAAFMRKSTARADKERLLVRASGA